MSNLKIKPGRRIKLNALVDWEKKTVQIIRNLHDTKGFLVDSGNMGYMPLGEFREFCERELAITCERPTLMTAFGLMKGDQA